MDVFDTILDLAGLDAELVAPPGTATDSRSFAACVNNPGLPVMGLHQCNYTELGPEVGGLFAIRDSRDKRVIGNEPIDPIGDSVLNPGGGGRTGMGGSSFGDGMDSREELYDLILDPLETTNLLDNPANKSLEIAAALREKREALLDSPIETRSIGGGGSAWKGGFG